MSYGVVIAGGSRFVEHEEEHLEFPWSVRARIAENAGMLRVDQYGITFSADDESVEILSVPADEIHNCLACPGES